MRKHIAIATFATMTMAISMGSAWSADTATDTGQITLQTASIPTLRQSIASAGGYDLKAIELKHTAHQLTATIVNSKQNGASSVDREKEAVAMVSAMEAGIAGKPEF